MSFAVDRIEQAPVRVGSSEMLADTELLLCGEARRERISDINSMRVLSVPNGRVMRYWLCLDKPVGGMES